MVWPLSSWLLNVSHRVSCIVPAIAVALCLSSAACAATGRAIVGQPYGVAEVTVQLGPAASIYARSEAFSLHEARGAVRAPVFSRGQMRDMVGNALGVEPTAGTPVTVMFLFEGEQPLRISLDAGGSVEQLILTPERANPRVYRRLLQRWWREYHAAAREAEDHGDTAVIYQYTTGLLAQQLNLAPPLASRLNEPPAQDATLQTLQLLGGLEQYRGQLRSDTLLQRSDRGEPANLPLPQAIEWLEPAWRADENVAIEPIALRVPDDCFYIRFGTFPNYLWFTDLLKDYGGDLSTMVAPRSIERSLSEQVEGRLGLKQSALAEVVGPAVIADVALVGYDLYTVDGPALGILFQARNNAILGNDLRTQRRTAAEKLKTDGAHEETVEIAGHKVSFVSTPDNRMRSFYATDGDFHFVTTSRMLAERFLKTSDGQDSLGRSAEFMEARTRMPLDREDTIFAYFSTRFFQQLVSPHYQIELARRLRAATDMELLLLAHLAARGQGHEMRSAAELIEGRFLPPSFAFRPEDGQVELGDERIIDTLRGARGAFIPIPDMELSSATSTEVATYERRAAYYATNWKQFDPLMVGIRRYALNDKGLERLAIEAHVAPLDETKYGRLLSVLGPATNERIMPVPGDIIAVQAFVQGGLFDQTLPPHHLFLGVQDSPADLRATGFLSYLQVIQRTPGYLGGWPKPGFLDWLPPFLGGGEPDLDGYSRLPLGIWRRQFGDFSVLSLDRGLLEHVTNTIAIEPAPPAQLRLYMGDLSQAQLQGFINDLAAERALRASYGNMRLAHTLAEQLQLPREIALAEAERLVHGKLVCPLGGEYQLVKVDADHARWQSTAWLEDGGPPQPYQAPLLGWFRGANADLTRTADGVIVRAELDMQRDVNAPAVSLPLFDLFRGTRPSAAPAAKPAERHTGPRRF